MRFSKPQTFVKFEGSDEDFINELKRVNTIPTVAIGKLKGGKNFRYFWWDDFSDKWFIGNSVGNRKSYDTNGCWITLKDFKTHIRYFENMGLVKLKIK